MGAASVDLVPRPPGSRRVTPLRTTQIEDEIWLPAMRIAKIRGDTLSKVLRDSLIQYVERYKHLLDQAEDDA